MAETSASPELKTYKGACHCGAIKFSVSIPEIKSVTECNCSICSKKGYAWVFPPAGGLLFEEGKGEEKLKDYEFAGKRMAHRFCPTCGTGVMGKRHNAPAGMDIGVNVRTLEDANVWELEVNKYDGASLEPRFQPYKFAGPEPTAEVENAKMYYGSCHCGATTIALKNKGPLDSTTDIRECNCSICYKRSLIHTYPLLPQFSIVTDPARPLTPYIFGRKMQHHMFCSNCGVQVYIRKLESNQETYRLYGRPDSSKELKEGSEELEKEFKWWGTWTPINMRVFEGVQWGGEGGLDVKKTHWKGFLEGVEFEK